MLRTITATFILILVCAGWVMLAPTGHAVPAAAVADSPFTIKGTIDPQPNVAHGWGYQLIGTASLPDGTRLPRVFVRGDAPIHADNAFNDDSAMPDAAATQADGDSPFSIAGHIVPSSSDFFDADRHGDLNQDGKIDILDVLWMLGRIGEVIDESTLEVDAADLDGDGIVSMSDLLLLLGSFGG